MISAVVLAAGRSVRMGGPKLVMKVGGTPILGWVLGALRRSKVDEVVVVLGAGADRVRREVRFEDERVVVNGAPDEGMSSSLRLGLKRVSPRSKGALIVLGDQPFLAPSTVDRLIESFDEGGAPVVVPVHKGFRGNPVLFARSVFPEIMRVRGDVGAKSVVKMHGGEVLEVPVDDPGIAFDIDTPSDFERAPSVQPRRRRSRGGA